MLYLNDHIQSIPQQAVAQAMAQLPQWRRDQALRFKHQQGQLECVLSFLELCRGLRLEYGITSAPIFQYNQHGKPSLAGLPQIHFSLSHCQIGVGCLLSSKPCGFDIERIRPAKPSLVEYTMNEHEVQQIRQSPFPDIAFTRLWTQKEAVLKLLGTGLTDELRNILQLPDVQKLKVRTIINPHQGYVYTEALVP